MEGSMAVKNMVIAILSAVSLLLVSAPAQAHPIVTPGEAAVIYGCLVIASPFIAAYYVVKYATWPVWGPDKYFRQHKCPCCGKRSKWIIVKGDRCPDCRANHLCQKAIDNAPR
jgi:hypothetical protein